MWPFGPFNRYPYTDFHELNADWILDKMHQLESKILTFSKDIKEYVFEWLDLHPEATTTVLDGSITFQKLNESVSDSIKISAKNYPTVADMIDADLEAGMYAHTAGYHSSNDTGAAYYEITSSIPSGALYVELDNGNYAKLIHGTHINPAQVGAVLDGTTDDTAVIRNALDYASIVFPSGADVKLNNLYVPDFREIDFNGSFVSTDHYAIVCGATLDHGYVRDITIKNAHFKVPTTGGAALHTYGGIYLDGAIKARILNCELANAYSGSELAILRNCFNCSVNNCYAGTGNVTTYSNSCGVVLYAGDPIIAGSDDLTNNDIRNCLFQNITYGILINSTDGLTDTCSIDNVGFSYVGTAIKIEGGTSANRNIKVDTIRVEFSDNAIENTGRLSVNNIYMTRIQTAGISNSGYLTLAGEFAFYNPDTSKPAIVNSGQINAVASIPNLINNGTITNTGYYTKPYLKGESDSNNFAINKYIHKVTGTSGSAGGSVNVAYPDGFDKTNAIVIAKQLYRSNGSYVSDDAVITATLATSNIVVWTSTTDSTTFDRGFEIFIIDKNI